MAAAQYSNSYYSMNNNNNNTYQQIHHHHQSQPQKFYDYPNGHYDCKNKNVNDAYNNYNYNLLNDQWTPHYNAISSTHHHQTQPHYQHQHLNMLNNQINDDYKDYSHHSYTNIPPTAKPIPSDVHLSSNGCNEHQPNLNCRKYTVERKNDLYYGQQPLLPLAGRIDETIAPSSPYPSKQLESSRKRKIDNSTSSDDSPALRALLTQPAKREKYSPYFFHSSQGSISPASSIDNYPLHYQLPSVPLIPAEEQSVNLKHYDQLTTKSGYEPSTNENQNSKTILDGKFCEPSLFSPSVTENHKMKSFIENIATPPSSPKDVNKADESSDNLWNDQNGGSYWIESRCGNLELITIKL
jgi:hypothetical protein